MRAATGVTVIAVALGLAACQADTRPRYSSEQDGFSIVALSGWQAAREGSSVVFRPPAQAGLDRVTVAVRAVRPERGWEEARTPARAVEATAEVLRGLPGAEVTDPVPLRVEDLEGARFELSFVPADRPGQRYQRRHVVLVGKERRVFHVLMTGPEGSLAATGDLFETVVASLRQEV